MTVNTVVHSLYTVSLAITPLLVSLCDTHGLAIGWFILIWEVFTLDNIVLFNLLIIKGLCVFY